jgi:HD superfamily phosphohydrolase
LDFLLRDSLYAGVDYGRFDLQRVFHSLSIGNIEGENHLLMLLKGLHAFEGFFLAYHHMYWQVYLHKTTRACELLLEKIFLRMKERIDDLDIDFPSPLESLLSGRDLTLEEFFLMDDCTILETIKRACDSRDEILSDLCRRFLCRNMFKCVEKKKFHFWEDDRRIRKFFEECDIPYDYYFAYDEIEQTSVERPILEKDLLMVDIDKSGTVSGPFDLIDESDIIRSLYNVNYTKLRMYCPEKIAGELKGILKEV